MLKKLSFLFLLVCSIQMFSFNSSSNTSEAIISVQGLNAKNYEDIKNTISAIDGVTLLAYCSESNCFLLNFDSKKIESAEYILRVIENLNPHYKAELKIGTSVNQLINDCTKFATPALSEVK